MSLRDWLIIIGVVIILGILIDGYRRMRLARMDSLKMSRDMGGEIENTPLDDDFNPELPGSVRVVAPGVDSSSSEPQLDLDSGENNSPDDQEYQHGGEDESPLVASREDVSTNLDMPLVADQDSRVANQDEQSDVLTAHAGKARQVVDQETVDQQGQEVLVINVDCRDPAGFPGTELKKLLEACGMDHGEMSIFHRHEEDDLLSPIQFSVANAVEPGYFDPENLEALVTPGVSFFMSLPGPKDYMKAYDYMLETAQVFARNLDGELKDEHRSVLTAQTIEHNRQRIREFERKQLSKARA